MGEVVDIGVQFYTMVRVGLTEESFEQRLED